MSDFDALWRFALDLYAKPGAADACLLLQDRARVDVPFLLFAVWMARRGTPLDAHDVRRIEGAVSEWRRTVITPLREVRRAMKHAAPLTSPDAHEALRTEVKRLELAAERLELTRLAQEARAMPPKDGGGEALKRSYVLSIVRHFSDAGPDAELQSAVDVIVETGLAAAMEA